MCTTEEDVLIMHIDVHNGVLHIDVEDIDVLQQDIDVHNGGGGPHHPSTTTTSCQPCDAMELSLGK